METSRLLAAIKLVTRDLDEHGIRDELAAVAAAIQSAASNPTDVTHHEQFSKALESLYMLLNTAEANVAPISIVGALKQMGVAFVVGSEIKAAVRKIMATTPFLLPQASAQFEKLQKRIETNYTRIQAAAKSLVAIGVTPASITTDEFEAGILMPSSFTHDDLRETHKHLHNWLVHLDTLSELTSGEKREKIPIRSASSGSFDIFLSIDVEGAMALLLIAGGVVKIMNSVRDAKRRREETANAGYPRTVIDQMEKHEQTLVEQGKEEIKGQLMERKHASLTTERANELNNGVSLAIDYVLRSMNRGVDVEVSTPPRAADKKAEVDDEIRALNERIDRLSRELAEGQKKLPDRTEPLLELPGPLQDDGQPNGEKPKNSA